MSRSKGQQRGQLLQFPSQLPGWAPKASSENHRSLSDRPITGHRNVRTVAGCTLGQLSAVTINGDSLIGEHICDGDVALVRLNLAEADLLPESLSGRLVAVSTRHGLLIKRLYPAPGNRVRLASANPEYRDLILHASEVEIEGFVIRIERDFQEGGTEDPDPAPRQV